MTVSGFGTNGIIYLQQETSQSRQQAAVHLLLITASDQGIYSFILEINSFDHRRPSFLKFNKKSAQQVKDRTEDEQATEPAL